MKAKTVNKYLKDKYGYKLYKLALDGGFTCPNRDGTLSSEGCIFCSAGGSGDFAASRTLSITEQIEEAKSRVSRKMKQAPSDRKPRYIAYFQAFTNTYGPIPELERIFLEAINHPDIAILSIATRPDCLGEEVLNLLSRLNEIKPVWIELGLQTIHEKTAIAINRGYSLSVYDTAMQELLKRHIETIVHVILGLPGETKQMMLDTVSYVVRSGADGIKLQLLHVLKGTRLASDYESGLFDTLTLPEYLDILKSCTDILPEQMVVHRLTGDGPKKLLVAPMWSADKKKVWNEIKRVLGIE